MLTYDLSSRGSLPLYEYLYKEIKRDVVSGRIAPGEKLPSKRALAAHLKVSVVTVENAYDQLTAEGYILSKERSGYYAASVPAVFSPLPPNEEPPKEAPSPIIDLYSDAVPSDSFPFSVWVKLMRKELSENGEVFFSHTPPQGAYELRAAVRDHLYREKGLSVSASNIIIGSGTQHLFELMILLLGRETRWGLENPGYKKLSAVLDCLEVPYTPIDCDSFGLKTSLLESSDISALHLSPSHHFPTGAVMPASRRAAVLAWAEKTNSYIVEDDYDSEFRFVGRPIPPLAGLDQGGRVIYFNTFTKSIAPSLRISYMVLPDKMMDVFFKKLGFYTCTVPAFEQYTLARFISEGYFAKHLRRLKTASRVKRDSVIAAIKNSGLNGRSQISEQDSGLHFLLKLDTEKSDADLKSALAESGVKISFLSDFVYGQNSKYDHTLLINYSGIDVPALQKALEELSLII